MDAEGTFYQEQFRENLQQLFALREAVQEIITKMRVAEADWTAAEVKRLEAEAAKADEE